MCARLVLRCWQESRNMKGSRVNVPQTLERELALHQLILEALPGNLRILVFLKLFYFRVNKGVLKSRALSTETETENGNGNEAGPSQSNSTPENGERERKRTVVFR